MELIRVKKEAELAQCLDVRRRVFVEEQQVPAELEIDEYDATPDACGHVLALVDGDPVGAGRWRPYVAAVTAKLQRLAVLQALRGKGYGRRLVQELERMAADAGFQEVVLDAQCHAEAFYQKLGYETVSQEPFEEAGIPHVRMKKRLT